MKFKSGKFSFVALIIILMLYLREWSLDNVNPCCYISCGATHNITECIPLIVSNFVIVLCIIYLICMVIEIIFYEDKTNGKDG